MTAKSIKIAGAAIAIVATAYFANALINNAASLGAIKWTFRTYRGLAEAVGIYVCIVALGGTAWFVLLRGVHVDAQLGQALGIFGVANIGKYIPGNIGQLVGRVALARRHGFDTGRVVLTLFFEMAWNVFTAATVALLTLLLIGRTHFGPYHIPSIWFIGLVAAIVGVLPLAVITLLNRWRPPPLAKLLASQERISMPIHVPLACYALYGLTFISIGAIAVVLVTDVFGFAFAPFWITTGIVTVAWVVGFITPGAPAGAGVREALLVAALSPVVGGAVAVGVSIVLRVVTVVGDGTACVAAIVLNRALGYKLLGKTIDC